MSISELPHGIDGPLATPPQGVVKVDLQLQLDVKMPQIKPANGNGNVVEGSGNNAVMQARRRMMRARISAGWRRR